MALPQAAVRPASVAEDEEGAAAATNAVLPPRAPAPPQTTAFAAAATPPPPPPTSAPPQQPPQQPQQQQPKALRDAPSIVLPRQRAEYIRHIALDIGGSLIKLVYFSPDAAPGGDDLVVPAATGGSGDASQHGGGGGSGSGAGGAASSSAAGAAAATPGGNNSSSSANAAASSSPPPPPLSSSSEPRGGRMHFVKFETARIQDCLDFIEAKGLHRCRGRDGQAREVRVKATGGGAYKFADLFYERLGLTVEKEDEIGCSVAGCNFLLRAIAHEAFLYEGGQATFVPTNGERGGERKRAGGCRRVVGASESEREENALSHQPKTTTKTPTKTQPKNNSRPRRLPLLARQHRLGRERRESGRRGPQPRERQRDRRRHVLGPVPLADGIARL
jgi:hypothetical protein